MTDPRVCVLSLGGTITMTATEGGGVAPALGGEALLGEVAPALSGIEVTARTLSRTSGAALTPHAVLAAAQAAAREVGAGAQGVVVVQGTDTMEESAYLVDLVWRPAEPLVFTGAMRPAGTLGMDGPANLAAAIRTAADPAARDRGTLVVLNDEIHAARRVRKTHAGALQAFGSGEFGLLGRMVEGHPRFANRLARHQALEPPAGGEPFVALLETFLGDDGGTLQTLFEAGLDGAVIAAHGVGHVSPALADVIGKCAARIPVVLATRTGAGTTLRATYDFPGSEADLIARGALAAGTLSPRQARLLLWLLLATRTPGADPYKIPRAFAAHGAAYAAEAPS